MRDFADKHGLALSSDYAELLADPKIQAIVLATPNSLHADQIVAAARAGKPVFCEKPLALTRADAERAVQACRQAGVALGVGQDKRFWPSMRELKRVVESGVSGVRVTPLYWRVHVFGTEGSAEALGDTELVLHASGAKPRRLSFEPVNALRFELEAFADAVAGRAAYPVPTSHMIQTVSALEAIAQAIKSRSPVTAGAP